MQTVLPAQSLPCPFNTVAVVGLGLIGGSLCKTMKRTTQVHCLGLDIDPESVQLALKEGAIDEVIATEGLHRADLTLICLHPQATIDFILEHLEQFAPGSIVADVCGVKQAVLDAVEAPLQRHGVRFVGAHPMAGREFSGMRYAQDDLFDTASFIVTPTPKTDPDALEKMKNFARSLHFAQVVTASPEEHDAIIAFTSQLAHVVSNAYIKSPTARREKGFSAGSFLDLTRVAKLNEKMWTSLFLYNRKPLLFELDTLLENLIQYRTAIATADADSLEMLLREGRILKEESLNQSSVIKKD